MMMDVIVALRSSLQKQGSLEIPGTLTRHAVCSTTFRMPFYVRRILRALVAVSVAIACVLAVARVASAQTITIPNAPGSLGRTDSSGSQVPLRGQNNYPYGVSLADCLADQRMTFPIDTTNFVANDEIQAWASQDSNDCTDITLRSGATQRCWRVDQGIPLLTAQTVTLKVRDIIASPTTFTSGYTAGSASICGALDFSSFNVTFMVLLTGNAVSSVVQNVQADTIGPPALSGVSVTQGDTRLEVSWNSVGEAGATTATSVSVFYTPANSNTAIDAGSSLVSKDGGSETVTTPAETDEAGDILVEAGTTTTTADGGCFLTPNEITSGGGACSAPGFTSTGPDTTVQSISVGQFSSQATISGLTNGVTYAVGVAAQDAFLNNGTISDLQCQSPTLLNDFFETYRNDGGLAGGLCSLDNLGAPAGGATFALVSCATILALTRRQKRDDRAKKERAQKASAHDGAKGNSRS